MNGIKLFRILGITVFMHWSWFVVAAIEIESRGKSYDSLAWNIAEYLLLFAIVLMHEFGHALACRSVGGEADRIMLWPLGGVAFVNPPPRPGALLWSIAAGPLVNVVLAGISFPLLHVLIDGNLSHLIHTFFWLNVGLFIFNMLPIYPLDGGQILQSLLWFVFGRGRSMGIASVIGFIGAGGMAALALYIAMHGSSEQGLWIGIMTLFVASRCWSGWKQGVVLRQRENAPRHKEFACPSCGKSPVAGKFWRCPKCQTAFDTFETGATCPTCANQFSSTECLECREVAPFALWQRAAPIPTAIAL